MTNITKIYKTIRKMDGRNDCAFGYPCAAPILQDGIYYSKPHEKCEKIAQFFEKRLTGKRLDGHVVPVAQGKDQQDAKQEERPKEIPASTRQTSLRGKTALDPFQPFRAVEIQKAVEDVSPNKAPGADAIPALVYQQLKGLVPLLQQLITAMAQSGQIPKQLLEIIIAPLDKPGKSPHACDAKRPISLINTIMKIAEIVVYNRCIQAMEVRMHAAQHAYRRNRGTETHLTAMCGAAQKALENNKYATSQV